MKRNRIVEVTFEHKGLNPFTVSELKINFKVEAQVRLDPNRAEVFIHNMNPTHRNAISQIFDLNRVEYGGTMTIKAGYGNKPKIIFQGDIARAHVRRQGSEWIAFAEGLHRAEAFDNANLNVSFPKGTRVTSILKHIINQLGISDFKASDKSTLTELIGDVKLGSGEIFQGNASDVLKKIAKKVEDKLSFSFDETGFNALPIGSPNADTPIETSKETGLIGSPTITDVGVNLNMLLTPEIRNGTQINVRSPTALSLKQTAISKSVAKKSALKDDYRPYITEKITHIGDNREGDFITQVQTLLPLKGGVLG